MRKKTAIMVIAVVLMFVGMMYPQQKQINPAPDGQKAASADSRTLKIVHREAPIYPQEAKAKDIRGTVVVQAAVDKQGNVISARVVEGDKIFRDAALTAVKAFKFEPFTSPGLPAEITTQVKISFCGKQGC